MFYFTLNIFYICFELENITHNRAWERNRTLLDIYIYIYSYAHSSIRYYL